MKSFRTTSANLQNGMLHLYWHHTCQAAQKKTIPNDFHTTAANVLASGCIPSVLSVPCKSLLSQTSLTPLTQDSCGQLHSSINFLLIGLLWFPGVSVTVHWSGLPPAS